MTYLIDRQEFENRIVDEPSSMIEAI